jgi:Signal transduction histidine kinase regulating C4-dicarboxylate transport system
MDAMKDQPEETRKVLISTLIEKTNSILVSVSDSGSGIEASKVETVFDTFYTTKKRAWI